jgi:hypothetical protein
MTAEALNCPNCNAPLPMPGAGGLWVCLYCNSLVRLQAPTGEAPRAALAGAVAPEAMAEIKQLVLAGRRAEALERYRQAAQATPEEAEQAVALLARALSAAVIRRQQLNALGLFLVGSSAVAVAALLALAARGALAPQWALLLGLGPLAMLAVFAPGIRTSLRYLGARAAPAAILQHTYIGELQPGQRPIYTYRLLLEVRPPGAPPFQAELMLPVRHQSLAALRPGALLQVKYLPGDPASLLFDKRLAAGG